MPGMMMSAVRFHDYGGPEVLVLEQVARPEPKANEVLVRMMAAGVNPADWKFRMGAMKAFMPIPLPWIAGLDGAGVVEKVGAEVSQFKPGQAVYGATLNSYAEYTAVPAGEVSLKPACLTFEQAAAVPVGALTAWKAVIEDAKVQPGQRVLVQGAAGGVGLFAAQFAHWKGATVIGTASAANADFVRSLGVEQVIDYRSRPFEDVLSNIDVVVDTVGGEITGRSLRVLRRGGILVTVAGGVSQEQAMALGVQAIRSGRANADQLKPISDLIEKGLVKPAVGQVFPLSQARQAQELSQSGHGQGRIVLHIAG